MVCTMSYVVDRTDSQEVVYLNNGIFDVLASPPNDIKLLLTPEAPCSHTKLARISRGDKANDAGKNGSKIRPHSSQH